jgi:hypothetical protein
MTGISRYDANEVKDGEESFDFKNSHHVERKQQQ